MKPCATTDIDLTDYVTRLDELVTRCVSFLQEQLQQLDQEYKSWDESPGVNGGGQGIEDLTEQQAAWERRRAEEESRINEQLDCLTQAWSALEEEQRRQMTEGPPVHSGGAVPADPPDHGTSSMASIPVDLIDAPCDLSSSAAEIQFQKLKREIRQHTKRNR